MFSPNGIRKRYVIEYLLHMNAITGGKYSNDIKEEDIVLESEKLGLTSVIYRGKDLFSFSYTYYNTVILYIVTQKRNEKIENLLEDV